jgi:hypothetical protein
LSNPRSEKMRSFTILAWSVTIALAPVARAEDAKPNGPSPHRGTHVATAVHPPAANAARGRIATQGDAKAWRSNHSAVAQPVRRTLPAPIAQDQVRNHTGQQTIKRSQPHAEARSAAGRNFQKGNNIQLGYFEAARRCRHERHDCYWWRQHYTNIVFMNRGYYYWDSGYWYPAWGYDPVYDYYDYDGPIYTYGNLLPDQVIANVQSALQQEGYYRGSVNGSLGAATRAAIANYQRDHGLIITAAIDEPTIESLGLD